MEEIDVERNGMSNNLGIYNDPIETPQPKANGSTKFVQQNSEGGIEDIDESGRITKVLMPKEKQLNIFVKEGDKMIGDYKIEKTLGQGTFGKVK